MEHKNIPSWLLEKNKHIPSGKTSNTGFLTKTINGLSEVLQQVIFSEVFARKKGFLQLIDPRVKLITLVSFMIFGAAAKSFITLIFLAFIALLFASFSRLEITRFLKHVWLFMPLIIFVFSIPAVLYYGLYVVLKMVFRVGVSISFAYLLIMTTRWQHIAKSLDILKVPTLVITVLHMTYRYIFLISKTASDMMTARFLRTVNGKTSSGRSFVSRTISLLFIKSDYLSSEIYSAMRCRGYSGEIVAISDFKIKKADVLWIVNNALIMLILILGELLF